jgi:hypothetical protein
MSASRPLGEERVLSIAGADIAIRLHRPAKSRKAATLIFLGGEPELLANIATQADCLIVALPANASAESGQSVMSWMRGHARDVGADASRLALGAAGAAAPAALAIAASASDQLRLLMLIMPELAEGGASAGALPSTFVLGGQRDAALNFVSALLAANVEAELHLGTNDPGDFAQDTGLCADALKRAFKN